MIPNPQRIKALSPRTLGRLHRYHGSAETMESERYHSTEAIVDKKCPHGVYDPHGTGEFCSFCKEERHNAQ